MRLAYSVLSDHIKNVCSLSYLSCLIAIILGDFQSVLFTSVTAVLIKILSAHWRA